MTEPATPRIVTRDEWERACAELLVREKAHTRAGDELAAARRRLPMTRMEPVMVVGPDGPISLYDVLDSAEDSRQVSGLSSDIRCERWGVLAEVQLRRRQL